ncbi:MAG: UDP-N-acetylmuramoyl-tripeptide--D-alanyl-D-alanine ligase [Bacteroidales bacterium]|nr:UDP-N-acetylmuramoyl-tripeptide--D-alanyl-D-alanine ligase [Bacteroidales bacterium]
MIINIAIAVLLCAWLIIKLRFELQMFQQNSYRNERYAKWLKKNIFAKERIFEIIPIWIIAIVIFFNFNNLWLLSVVPFYAFLAYKLLTKKTKLKLNFTNRAKRLFFTSLGIVAIVSVLYALFSTTWLMSIIFSATICAFLTFAILPLSNIILKPVENHINNFYINDAKRILSEHKDLIIIGITGSYGKTSTKHFLETILSQKYNVLMTPGSFNTTMGVVRTIREYLKPTHQIFICEMGAKQIGDIKEICDLVNPSIGILTSVAEQHLDTFKNIENVRKTKFELIDSLPNDGLAILNGDYEIIKNFKINKNAVYYSLEDKGDFVAKDIVYSQSGTEFNFYEKGEKKFSLKTELLGDYNVSDILACIVCAYKMGLTTDQISFGVHKLQAVQHRMEIKVNAAGIVIIDDAFNSNPKGAKMALQVLSGFTNQRFVITPGIVELADRQDYYNEKLGEQIAESVDMAVLVGKKQTEAIYKGLKNKNYPEEKIYIASDLMDAANHVYSIARPGDTILFENDLPDIY